MKNKNTQTVYGHLSAKMGFSFVELIIVISIIALISVIGLSINNNYTEKSKNSKITSDIMTIKNSLESYKSENKTLPYPKGNQKYFDDSSNYVHYDDPTAFGVYGNITENTIPKKYMNYLPIDPRTNQYYAYGKTLSGELLYELAGVNKTNGNFESKVVGDYSGDNGPYNLIREYNGPDFVYDQSKSNFPYNPEERVVKCKIGSFSGSVYVNGSLTPVTKTWIQNNDLVSGNSIYVSTGSQAELFYSDGSKSYLGTGTLASRLVLANMVYKGENNLFTKIQLALDYGSIWSKTSKLDTNSSFEIYTTDTEAAVRGTIFGVNRIPDQWGWANTKLAIQTGSVELVKIMGGMGPLDINTLVNKIKTQEPITTMNFMGMIGMSNVIFSGTTSTIVGIYGTGQTVVFDTISAALTLPTIIPNPSLPNEDGLSNIRPKIKSIISGEVTLEFPSSFSVASNRKNIKIKTTGDWADLSINYFQNNGNLLKLLSTITYPNYSIKICNQNGDICTQEVAVNKELSYNAGTIGSGCASNEVDFGTLGCIKKDSSLDSNWDLVAYAPYDDKNSPNYTDIYFKNFLTQSIDTHGNGTNDIKTNNTYDFSNDVTCDEIDKLNSFCRIGSEKGVFIDNENSQVDSIQYSLSAMNSTGLGNDFAIEINVMGKDLQRTMTNNYLFYTDKYRLSTYISTPNNNIKLYQLSPTISSIKLLENDYTVSNLNPNEFYSVIFKKEGSLGTLTINGVSKSISSLDNTYGLGSYIYIGGYVNNYQWNGVINYVKIYKKNI